MQDRGLSADAHAAARGSVALMVVQSMGRALGLLFVVVATRELVPAAYGRYATVAAFAVLGGLVADFGTSTVIVRRGSRRSEPVGPLLHGTLLASFGLGLAAFALSLLVAVVMPFPAETRGDLLVGGWALPFGAVASSLFGALDGHGLIARRSLGTMLQVATLAIGGVAALLLGFGVRGALVALAAAPVVGGVVAAVQCRCAGLWNLRVGIDVERSLNLLRESVPFGLLAGISALALRFDVLLVTAVAGEVDTARYELAVRLIEALSYLAVVVSVPSLFILSRRLGSGDLAGAQRAYDEAARLVLVLGLGVSALLVALSEPLATLLFGSAYAGVGPPLAILGAQLFLAFLVAVQGAAILSGDKVTSALPIAAGITSVTIILDLAVVWKYGAIGAAAATAAGQVVAVAVFAVYIRRTIGLHTHLPPAGALAAAVTGGAAAWVLRDLGVVVAAGSGVTAYALVLMATRTVRRSDLRRLAGALSRRPVNDAGR